MKIVTISALLGIVVSGIGTLIASDEVEYPGALVEDDECIFNDIPKWEWRYISTPAEVEKLANGFENDAKSRRDENREGYIAFNKAMKTCKFYERNPASTPSASDKFDIDLLSYVLAIAKGSEASDSSECEWCIPIPAKVEIGVENDARSRCVENSEGYFVFNKVMCIYKMYQEDPDWPSSDEDKSLINMVSYILTEN
ncbi:MAG: hypothetical protein LBJ92_04650 [Holosporales bacterium]|jgi:hypothetical protein|nr:hypothetical protein [Holosporales bacterium]